MSVRTLTGMTGRGDPIYSTTVTVYRARQEATVKLIKDGGGRDVIIRKQTFVGPAVDGTPPAIRVQDVVTMPDGTQPKLVQVDTLNDQYGVSHQVLYT